MRFKITYCIYLIISLFYEVIPLMGPITLRHILTIVMLFMCYIEHGLKLDKFLKWYLVFLGFHAFVEVYTGFSAYIVNKILGTYLASIALYLATKIMVKKYNAGDLIIKVLVIAGVVNAFVAIGQFYGSRIAQIIPQRLHIYIKEEYLELYEKDDLHGLYVGGLMGPVASGYFLSATSILALYNKNNKISIYNWAAFAIIIFGLFLVQERAGLASGIFCTLLFIAIFTIHNRKSIKSQDLVKFFATIVVIYIASCFVSIKDTRYFQLGLEDEERPRLAFNALKWVINNPLGGKNYYYSLGGGYPHNFLVNSLLFGGVIGGTVIIGIVFSQLLKILKIGLAYLVRGMSSPLLLSLGMAYLCYTINSFFHNYSLVTGGEIMFLLWGMTCSLIEMDKDIINLKSYHV